MIFDGLRETELIQIFSKSSFQIKYKIEFQKSRTFFFLSSKNQNRLEQQISFMGWTSIHLWVRYFR